MDIDVEPPAPLPASALNNSSMSPPIPPASPDLPRDQLTAFTTSIKSISSRNRWQGRVDEAGDNDSHWRELSCDILVVLLLLLSRTTLSESFLPVLTPDEVDEFLKGFDDNDFREWKDKVRKSVKEGNWMDLVAHRMHHYA